MRKAIAYVVSTLLAFFARGVLSNAFVAPRSYSLWDRPSARAVGASERQIAAGPMIPRQDPDSVIAGQMAKMAAKKANETYIPYQFNVSQECVLWDETCTGDRQRASNKFFNQTYWGLLGDRCFRDTRPPELDQCTGTVSAPSASLSLWSTLKSWMREPACTSELAYSDRNLECCNPCVIGAPNVDVYYWPSPNANTSCLSIIGTNVNPLTDGATTSNGRTYWAYTPTDANIYNPIITTMVYTSINGIYFKQPMVNPWEIKPGMNATTSSELWNAPGTNLPGGSITIPRRYTATIQQSVESPESGIQARANPIAIPNQRRAPINESNGNPVGNDSSPGSIVIYNGHTFTSPSIYVDFYSLSATDACGYRGPIINSTLLAFAPGELSTIATPMLFIDGTDVKTSVYNFNDLPCPPMSVMWDQWYKPEPGEPYRPMIAFPSKVVDLNPLWKSCSAGWFFTGYDPPRTLVPAGAMLPKVTPPSSPNPIPEAAKPAATQENLPKRTTTSVNPANTPSNPSLAKDPDSSGVEEDPSQRPSINPLPKNQGSNDPQENPPQGSPTPGSLKTNPVDPALPKTAANSDPHQQANNIHAHQEASAGDGDTINQPQPLAPSSPTVQTTVLGGLPVLASAGGYNIDGLDVKPGASTTGANGQEIAVDLSNNLHVGGQTAHINPAASPATIANHVVTPLSKGAVVEGSTLEPGGPAAVVASTTFSVDAANNILIDSHPYPLPEAAPAPTVVNGQAVTPLATGASIHSTTLTPGAQGLAVSGTLYSLDLSSNLHYGGSIYALPIIGTGDASAGVITAVAGQPIADLFTGISIAGTTLTPGAHALVISGTSYSLDASRNLHYDGSIYALPIIGTGGASAGAITAVAGQPVVDLLTGISIAGTTLTPGAPAITGANGVRISLGASNLVVVGSATVPVRTVSSAGHHLAGVSGPGLENGTGINTSGGNGSAVRFTGGSEGRKLDSGLSLSLSLSLAVWVAAGIAVV